MGFLKPTVRPGVTQPLDEIQRLEARAKLPHSKAANFIRGIGIILILLGCLLLVSGGVYGLVASVGVIIAGGFTLAAGALQQIVFDIRTLMLRTADRREDEVLNAISNYEAADA